MSWFPSNSGWVRKVKAGPMPRACSAMSERDLPAFRTPCSPSKKRNKTRDRFPWRRHIARPAEFPKQSGCARSRTIGFGVHGNSNPGSSRCRRKPRPRVVHTEAKGTEIQQRISELNLEAGGLFGSAWGLHSPGPSFARGATQHYLGGRATTIYGVQAKFKKTSSPKTCWGWVSAWIYH